MNNSEEQRAIFDKVRERLAGQSGRDYWRSLDQVAETPEFQQWMDDEFPNRSSLLQIDRRSVLKFMGASIMLAGLGGCRSLFLASEKVVPYVKMPEDLIPGKPMFYATTAPFFGSAVGLLVESHEGRPTKIEGNPDHPGSLGSSDSFAQASILDLYDPDRTIEVYDQGEIATWEMFLKAARNELAAQKAKGGSGLRILTTPVASPTEHALLKRLQTAYPSLKVVEYEPAQAVESRAGTAAVFGKELDPVYALAAADVVVSLDADFLRTMPGSIRMARDFSSRRGVSQDNPAGMSRLYAVESVPSLTGAVADHRKAVKPSQVEAYARALASALGIAGIDAGDASSIDARWVEIAAKDLSSKAGRSVVVPGTGASTATHAIAHAINVQLGNAGKTVSYVPAEKLPSGSASSLRELVDDLNSGAVDFLLVLGGNPAFDAPSDLPVGDAIQKAKFSAHHATSKNETSAACQWHTPDSHFLEAWGDARYVDGTASIAQPLIAPLYQSKSTIELLSALLDQARTGLELVQATWKAAKPSANFDQAWQEWLNAGVVPGSAATPEAPVLQNGWPAAIAQAPQRATGLEIAFRPDPTIWDGRWANNGWLQELPKPLTTLTWENAAMVSPKLAETMGLANGDMVAVEFEGAKLELPTYIHVGHPEESVTIHFGYGRTEVGNVGSATGANAYRLRRSSAMWFGAGVEVKKLGRQVPLGLTQTHFGMEGRGLVKAATLAEFAADPEMRTEGEELAEKGLSMYPDNQFKFDGPQWGMTIDLNLCTGCHACVTACQAENNIPVVGKEQVVRGREMHWIRIDRYYKVRDSANPRDAADQNGTSQEVLDSNGIETVFQPVACMHCEKAPCEPVCPVAATVHSHEGLNQMVYNRCVGTRYCSNNCPYKVRRFNFLNYTDNMKQFDDEPKRPLLRMLNNPDVTVRGRGVMEKCTYCVQRINDRRIEAKKAGRPIADGEVVTACQQACPSKAIVFGNVADPGSAVSKSKRDVRNYSLLPELNTVNRTTYLTKLRNPHPELEKA